MVPPSEGPPTPSFADRPLDEVEEEPERKETVAEGGGEEGESAAPSRMDVDEEAGSTGTPSSSDRQVGEPKPDGEEDVQDVPMESADQGDAVAAASEGAIVVPRTFGQDTHGPRAVIPASGSLLYGRINEGAEFPRTAVEQDELVEYMQCRAGAGIVDPVFDDWELMNMNSDCRVPRFAPLLSEEQKADFQSKGLIIAEWTYPFAPRFSDEAWRHFNADTSLAGFQEFFRQAYELAGLGGGKGKGKGANKGKGGRKGPTDTIQPSFLSLATFAAEGYCVVGAAPCTRSMRVVGRASHSTSTPPLAPACGFREPILEKATSQLSPRLYGHLCPHAGSS
jgi:hypothetical protein